MIKTIEKHFQHCEETDSILYISIGWAFIMGVKAISMAVYKKLTYK